MTAPGAIHARRAYGDTTWEADGVRILVDRVWPRGVRREDLRPDLWLRDLAPSDELRRWFGHRVERWEEFQRRYRAELATPTRAALLEQVRDLARHGPVLLLYGARDEEHNQAVVLSTVLTERDA